MDIIEKLYTEWAWRSKSGTPNMENPDDKQILETLIFELVDEQLPKEDVKGNPIMESDEGLDKFIIDALGEIPKVYGSYTIPNSSTDFTIDPKDKEAFKKVYKLAVDQNMGYGEIALYWLYNYQESGLPSKENRGAGAKDAPDLKIGDNFVEVKSYGSDGQIKLGKFASDYKNLRILNAIFALNHLTKIFDFEKEKKVIIPTNFRTEELLEACNGLWKFKSVDLDELAEIYDIFKELRDNFYNLLRYTNSPEEPGDMAKMVISALCKRKFGRKPGMNQFIVEVSPEGKLQWFKVTEDRLESDLLMKYTAVVGGEITANYRGLFPQ